MSQTLVMTLCNISDAKASWEIIPHDARPILVVQEAREFGTVEVPSAAHYRVCCGRSEPTSCANTEDPDVLAVYTGGCVVVSTAAG